MSQKREISVSGPVNGMGQPDKAGSYVRVKIKHGFYSGEFSIPKSYAKTLRDEIDIVLEYEAKP